MARLDAKPSHETVRRALVALSNLEHRGASGADAETGDGAGILLQIPHLLLTDEIPDLPEAGRYGVGAFFLPQDDDRRAELEHLNEALPPLFKLRKDPRVTRLGRILRATSLDELPQLINVIAGDMSIVGPRPRLPQEFSLSDPAVARRLSVKPGLAGLWQVSGRATLNFDEALALDLQYIERWSFWLDLKLIAQTFWVVVTFHGAY